ncbi:MAG TPA: response regulator, partial [Gammaproteobacteria bacterium]|nr:response regulator [Gammaproteobacteria bacterium]
MASILVVDDEEGIRKVLRQVLEYEGHEVRVASGGGESLTLFQRERPDLTLL